MDVYGSYELFFVVVVQCVVYKRTVSFLQEEALEESQK